MTTQTRPPRCHDCADTGIVTLDGVAMLCPAYHHGEAPLSTRRKLAMLALLTVLAWLPVIVATIVVVTW